jgi:hypothetical protein
METLLTIQTIAHVVIAVAAVVYVPSAVIPIHS